MADTPTILQLLPELRSGGVERGTVDMAAAIVEGGAKALVVSAGGPMVDEVKAAGATHITLPVDSKSPWRIYRNVAALEQIISEYQVSLLHARSRAPAWSGYMACCRAGIPFLTTFHGTYGLVGPGKRAYNAVMVKGELVIAVSEFIAEHMRGQYGVESQRIRVIPRGVDMQRFHPDAVTALEIRRLIEGWALEDVMAPVLLMPGRLTRWKGQHIVLHALSRLPHRDFMCLFVGEREKHPNYYNELRRLTSTLKLERCVRFVEPVRHIAAAYKLCDGVLCPSIEPEAFGRISIEAQAMGKPVIAADHGGARETVRHGETGWLVRPGNIQSLAEAIVAMLNLGQSERETMAEAGRAHVGEHFSLAQMQSKTLDVYEELLAGASS